MCGIFGIVTDKETLLGPILVEAARRLTYRGYDSVGAATLNSRTIDLRKDAGKVDEVASRYNLAEMRGSRGIVQLRWATFGGPSRVNAQPHLDSDGDMVGAHNGNIVNNVELRRQFMAEGMVVRSENDGETCVHAVERYVNKGYDFIDAIRLAYGDLKGDYAFVIGRLQDECLYAFKKGSGLVAGIGEGFTCVSSDLPSIIPLTRRVLRLNDGEIVVLYADRVEIRSVKDGALIEREPELVTESMDQVQKGGYPHFMLKEIHEQSQVARELLHWLDGNFADSQNGTENEMSRFLETMEKARHLYLIGCGTSYHACLLGSVYLAGIAGRTAIPVLAPQFMAQYLPSADYQDAGIFVSQSGETKDVLNALEAARSKGMTCLGLANVIGSTLNRAASCTLPLCCGYEISVPATKTFTNQVVTFLYLAYRLARRDTGVLESIPELLEKTLQMVEPGIDGLAESLNAWNDMYCLGYGLTYAIALEGALKLKEITYAHCEGMLSTEFKHGPLSAVTKDYPVIFVVPNREVDLIISGINEVTCRGGRAIAVGQDNERLRANAHVLLEIPAAPPEISALLAIVPLQLLAYRMSVLRGYDPDFPRNLSKTLTVD